MKKRLVPLLLGLTGFLVSAQEPEPKFSLGVFISPNLADRIGSDLFSEIETPKFGYSGGLFAGYAINKKLKLQAGVSFSDNGYLIRMNDLRYGDQFDSTGFNPSLPTVDPTDVRFVYKYYFIDIPVYIKYTFFAKKKIGIYVVSGPEANINLANRQVITLWYDDGNKEKENTEDVLYGGYEFRTCNLSLMAGVGIDIMLNSSIALFIQPTYRQMLLSDVNNSPPLKRRYYSVGLATGITFNL